MHETESEPKLIGRDLNDFKEEQHEQVTVDPTNNSHKQGKFHVFKSEDGANGNVANDKPTKRGKHSKEELLDHLFV
jgi:hypothetical protein